jgi:transposase InsO family protein
MTRPPIFIPNGFMVALNLTTGMNFGGRGSHSLKVELIHGKTYDTRQEAKTAIIEYIEVFYNRQRRHSYLGYLSPADFEKKNAA